MRGYVKRVTIIIAFFYSIILVFWLLIKIIIIFILIVSGHGCWKSNDKLHNTPALSPLFLISIILNIFDIFFNNQFYYSVSVFIILSTTPLMIVVSYSVIVFSFIAKIATCIIEQFFLLWLMMTRSKKANPFDFQTLTPSQCRSCDLPIQKPFHISRSSLSISSSIVSIIGLLGLSHSLQHLVFPSSQLSEY